MRSSIIKRWTKEALDDLARLLSEGKTCREISKFLTKQYPKSTVSFSRNAVIGKAHRLRLPRKKIMPKPKQTKADGAKRKKATNIFTPPTDGFKELIDIREGDYPLKICCPSGGILI